MYFEWWAIPLFIVLYLLHGVIHGVFDNRGFVKYESAMERFDNAYAENNMGIANHDLIQGQKILRDQIPFKYHNAFDHFCRGAAKRYELNQNSSQWKL